MYLKNTAGQFIHFQGVDATTGGIKSGVTWTVRRCIDGTFAAAGGTATEDGTTGWYKFALTQADTNGNDIGFNFTGTGAVPQTINIVTTVLNLYDGVRAGLTALPNAAAEAAGGLYTRGSGAGQINQPGNGSIDVNVIAISGDQTAADNAETAFDGGAFNVGGGAVVAASVTGAVGSVTGAVGSVTGAVGSVTGGVGGNVSGSVASVVGLTASNLDATVSSRLASGSYTAPDNAGVGAIKAKTDSLNFTVAGQVDANVQYVNDVQVTGNGQPGTEWGP